MIGVLLAAHAASAAEPRPTCEPLDEGEFRDLVLQLQSAIDRGDRDLPPSIVAEVRERVACFEFAPPPRLWAQYLAGEAVVSFAGGEPWEASMAAALRIYPGVDRGVSSRHPLASWEPPPVPVGGDVVPEGVYVDGVPSQPAPPADGLYLVQRTDGRFWNTVLVEDGELPDGWLDGRVVPPRHLASWFAVSGLLGVGGAWQSPRSAGNWVQEYDMLDRSALAPGAALDVQATFSSPFGILGGASGWLWAESPGADVHAAGIWTWRGLALGVGGGITAVDTYEGPMPESDLALQSGQGEVHRVHLLRYVLLAAHLRGGRRGRWHLGLTSGSSVNSTRFQGEAHLALGNGRIDAGGRWRLGLAVESATGEFERQGAPRDHVDAGHARVSLRLGRVWGEY